MVFILEGFLGGCWGVFEWLLGCFGWLLGCLFEMVSSWMLGCFSVCKGEVDESPHSGLST